MKTKEQKLALVDELVVNLGLTRDEVIDYFIGLKIKPGMFWYDDDTFSFERTASKKIKAVVELVEDGVIYGDLTASELFDIPEKDTHWDCVERFLKELSYPCGKKEKIIWYSIDQFQRVYDNYDAVKNAFDKLHKPYRTKWYWSSTLNSKFGVIFYMREGSKSCSHTASMFYIRPVLALKVE